MKGVCWLLVFLTGVLSCGPAEKQEATLFEQLPASHTGIHFSNEIREDKALNILSYEYFYNGAGVGVIDINQDSLPDLFFTSNMGASTLYLNKGNLQFDDITKSSGIDTRGKWASGVSIVDINQDGKPDIYICFAGPFNGSQRANELYINMGNNRFEEKAAAYGLADEGPSIQAAFFDYDKDGDLDCYILSNSTDAMGPNIIRPKRLHGEMENTDRLYRNEGNGKYSNVSAQAGILKEGYGLGLSIVDCNLDGWPDIFVSNDYLSNDLLYINNKDGSFTDQLSTSFKHTSYSAMGNDAGDINNDGWPDLVEVDMLPPDNYRQKLMLGFTNHDRFRSEIQMGYDAQYMRNSLHLHNGVNKPHLPLYSEIGQFAGIAATDWSWSPLLADFDNDGWRDLFISNGYPRDITNRDFITYQSQALARQDPSAPLTDEQFKVLEKLQGAYLSNKVFRNTNGLQFEDMTAKWGITDIAYGTGAAYADLDNDGDLDVVVTNTGTAASIYKNTNRNTQKGNFIQLYLEGPTGNRDAFGAQIQVSAGQQKWYQEHQVVRGYQSSVDNRMMIGLGQQKAVDSIVVVWPNGHTQTILQPGINQPVAIRYEEGLPMWAGWHNRASIDPQYLKQLDSSNGISFVHRETPYTDFNIQPLLPHKFSMGGPGIAVGDVNGDGLDDFYVGGAYKQPGKLFIQSNSQTFSATEIDTGKKNEEDMGALFFDADGDGDLDLYVVTGGNEFDDQSVYYQDRLYINDGRGNFSKSENALPKAPYSGSCVIAADFDNDGDLDLFIGGRNKPQHYPAPGRSQLLENRGGKFVDVTEEKAPSLASIGMVNGAVFSDYNKDGFADLILVGEWMPVTVFTNQNGKFTNSTSQLGLDRTVGWWNSITSVDFGKNGSPQFVLGNHGQNSRYSMKDIQPLGMYWSDFSGTGRTQAIITYTRDGKAYPIHPRDDVFQQLPALRKRFPLYADYAKAGIKELFSAEQLRKAEYRELQQLSSGILSGLETGKPVFKPFPPEAQLAPIFASLATDLNDDGLDDILLVGNDRSFEVINGPVDAFNGLCLISQADGSFTPQHGGLSVPGDGKALGKLRAGKAGTLILASQNNGPLLCFALRSSSR